MATQTLEEICLTKSSKHTTVPDVKGFKAALSSPNRSCSPAAVNSNIIHHSFAEIGPLTVADSSPTKAEQPMRSEGTVKKQTPPS